MRWTLLFLIGMTLTAQAQSTWPRQVLFQDRAKGVVIEARTPSNDILFTFGRDYPPASFPARYTATTPRNGVLPLQTRSNASGAWSLTLEISDLRDGSGRLLVPARQVLYRVQNGPWLRGNGTPQILYSQIGPTREWEELRLEFAIELLGNETAGTYAVQAYFGAVTQP